MSTDALDPTILGPAFVAGLLVLLTHVPLGREVLARGIIFIDLAVAQISGLGVIVADLLHFDAFGVGPELAAGSAAVAGALLLTWSERAFAEIQEALIGILFVLAATGSILLLAHHPHGGEELTELLVGQILWVRLGALWPAALLTAAVLGLWFGAGRERLGRTGFYLVFAVTVTVSVQLVGVYLVFASLIVPAVATRELPGPRGVAVGLAIGVAGYVLGLVVSALFDLPTGAVIVWGLAACAALWMIATARRGRATPG